MTWTYSGDPSLSSTDMVRFNCGLTDENDQLVTDEEIDALLVSHGILGASARICRRVAAKFARRADQQIGDYAEKQSQIARTYRQMADDFDAEIKSGGGGGAAGVIVGGTSVADKSSQNLDTDRIIPRFARGQFDNDVVKDQ